MNKIYVIGGANIDIIGSPASVLKLKDSNIGKISFAHGGVARNIAENLAYLDKAVTFVSAIGDDTFSKGIIEHLNRCCIDTQYVIRSKKYPTSAYLAILDEHRDMYVAMSDMDILKELSIEYLQHILDLIDQDDILVVDTNLAVGTLEYILKNSKARVFVDPISTAKVVKLKGLLAYIDTFKPNLYEAAELCGKSINQVEEIGAELIKSGVKHLYISLGSEGLYYQDAKNKYYLKAECTNIINATGAGDACMSAIIAYSMESDDIKDIMRKAIAAATITLEQVESVSKALNHQNILKKYQTLEYKWRS